MKHHVLILLGFGCVVASDALASAPLRDVNVSDRFGYRVAESADAPAECPYSPVALDGGASTLALSNNDDGYADVTLASPFSFYKREVDVVRVSSNGYLVLAIDDSFESGSDFNADCPLPSVPDNPGASAARIYALHADLQHDASSQLRAQYFSACPRPAASGAIEACTVFEWRDVLRVNGSGGRATTQAVLYHGSGEIAVQVVALPLGFAPSITLGVQSVEALSGVAPRCGEVHPQELEAVCFFDEGVESDPHFVIATSRFPDEGGSTSGDGQYVLNAPVQVVATAAEGYAFIDWTESGVQQSTDATYAFSSTTDRSLVANFDLQSYAVLGIVSPADAGEVTGSANYVHGSSVELTATPEPEFTFEFWTEAGVFLTEEPTISFLAEASRTLQANFLPTAEAVFVSGFESTLPP